MDKRLIEEIATHQRAILANMLNIKMFRDLTKVFENKHFGHYSAIFEFVCEHPEYDSAHEAQNLELFHHLKQSGTGLEKWNEVTLEPWISKNPYEDAEWLLRYYYFDAKDPSKIIETLDEYNEKRDALSEIRSAKDAGKYDGETLAMAAYEEMCERHDAYESGNASKNRNEPYWLPTLDHYTRGFRKGTVTRISAYSNTGKSKLTYFIGRKYLDRGMKVTYVSLEVPKSVIMMNLIANRMGVNVWDIEDGKVRPDSDAMDFRGLTIVDDMHDWDAICEFVEKNAPDLLVIDYVQNIRVKGMTELYPKMEFLASEIQLLAIRTGTRILDVSQVAWGKSKYKKGEEIPSKGSNALVSAADIGIVLVENPASDNFLSCFLAKNKFGPKDIEICLVPDMGKSMFEDRGEMNASGVLTKEV